MFQSQHYLIGAGVATFISFCATVGAYLGFVNWFGYDIFFYDVVPLIVFVLIFIVCGFTTGFLYKQYDEQKEDVLS